MFSQLEQFSSRTAVIDEEGNRYSYQQLLDVGEKLTAAAQKGTLVFFAASNTWESLAGYTAFLRRGVVPMMLASGIYKPFFDSLLERYQPQYLFLPNNREDLAAGSKKISAGKQYTLWQTSYEKIPKIHPDLALILSTSGSTGSPKGVRLSHQNLRANAESIREYLEISPEDRALTTMPMNYSYGLSIIHSHFISGAAVIATDAALMERRFWNLLQKEEPTTFGGVPYIYEMLHKLRFTRMKYPSLRYLTQAGGPLSAERTTEFAQFCADRGMKLIVMYGQTEATARMGYLPWEKMPEKIGSIGIAIPGGSFSLVDDDGAEIHEANQPGELVYRGENVSLGYAQGVDDLSKGDENRGILRTGDITRRDTDGYYYIVGRKKRFLKIFGNRVNLDEVERILTGAGYEAACSGTDDRLIVYTPSKETESILTLLADSLSLHPSAFAVVTLDKLPRNESGKIQYSLLPRN